MAKPLQPHYLTPVSALPLYTASIPYLPSRGIPDRQTDSHTSLYLIYPEALLCGATEFKLHRESPAIRSASASSSVPGTQGWNKNKDRYTVFLVTVAECS